MPHDDDYHTEKAKDLKQPIKYSKQRYARLSHGIHTWGEDDDFAFWLARNNHEDLIEWTD